MLSQRIEFEKLLNTRDLGGMMAADGRKIKTGKLYRSGHLLQIDKIRPFFGFFTARTVIFHSRPRPFRMAYPPLKITAGMPFLISDLLCSCTSSVLIERDIPLIVDTEYNEIRDVVIAVDIINTEAIVIIC